MFLITSKNGESVKMRDGVGHDAPMKKVGAHTPTLFNNLPLGLAVHGDTNWDVRVIDDPAGLETEIARIEKANAGEKSIADAHAAKVKAKIAKQMGRAKVAQAEAEQKKAEAEETKTDKVTPGSVLEAQGNSVAVLETTVEPEAAKPEEVNEQVAGASKPFKPRVRKTKGNK